MRPANYYKPRSAAQIGEEWQAYIDACYLLHATSTPRSGVASMRAFGWTHWRARQLHEELETAGLLEVIPTSSQASAIRIHAPPSPECMTALEAIEVVRANIRAALPQNGLLDHAG